MPLCFSPPFPQPPCAPAEAGSADSLSTYAQGSTPVKSSDIKSCSPTRKSLASKRSNTSEALVSASLPIKENVVILDMEETSTDGGLESGKLVLAAGRSFGVSLSTRVVLAFSPRARF